MASPDLVHRGLGWRRRTTMRHALKDSLNVVNVLANTNLVGLVALVSIYFYHSL